MLFWLLKDALLACKRCPLRGLLTPFWSPIKHLLIYYFITNWYTVDYKPTFYMPFCRYLLMSCLKLYNDFSKPFLQSFRVLKRKSFCGGGWKKIDNWYPWLYLSLMSKFCSSANAIRKAYIHLTEEPIYLSQTVVNNC